MTQSIKCLLEFDPIQSNLIHSSPWMNPIHVQLCSSLLQIFLSGIRICTSWCVTWHDVSKTPWWISVTPDKQAAHWSCCSAQTSILSVWRPSVACARGRPFVLYGARNARERRSLGAACTETTRQVSAIPMEIDFGHFSPSSLWSTPTIFVVER